MRNILAHGYDIVNYEILWDALEQKLPQLEQDLSALWPSSSAPTPARPTPVSVLLNFAA